MELKLYEIEEGYRNILELLENEDENEEYKKALENIKQNYAKKITNIGLVIAEMKSMCEVLKNRKTEIDSRKRKIENRIEKLKSWIKASMIEFNEKKIVAPQITISLRKNPMKVVVLDEAEIPQEYKKEKVIVNVDKIGIKKTYKENGIFVNGTTITEDESIQIKTD